MRKLTALFLVITLFTVTATACLTATSSSSSGIISPPNALGMGGSDDGIIVSFMEVVSDTRCPADAVCASPGRAEVKLGISINSGPQSEVILEAPPGGGAEHEAGDYTISFPRLLPDPPPQGGVEQSEYQIELTIKKD